MSVSKSVLSDTLVRRFTNGRKYDAKDKYKPKTLDDSGRPNFTPEERSLYFPLSPREKAVFVRENRKSPRLWGRNGEGICIFLGLEPFRLFSAGVREAIVTLPWDNRASIVTRWPAVGDSDRFAGIGNCNR